MGPKIYQIYHANFLSLPEFTWLAYLKTTGIKLELLTDISMLLMVDKGIRGGICHAIHRHAIASNKYIKNHDKNK